MSKLPDEVQIELNNYMKAHNIIDLFNHIAEALLLEKPEHPIRFMMNYLMKTYPQETIGASLGPVLASEQERIAREEERLKGKRVICPIIEDAVMELRETEELPALGRKRRSRRTSVSAESMKNEHAVCAKDLKTYPKSILDLENIGNILQGNILFEHLDSTSREIITGAMFPREYHNGDVIINQGEDGDNYYMLSSGECEVYVERDNKPVLVRTCAPGDSFGELALLYNSPRAATVIAKGNVSVWCVDRTTFRVILMETTVNQRKKYKTFLERVPLLESLTEYERLTIADTLENINFNKGETILNEGDPGDMFYIIESGGVTCTKASPDGPVEVLRLHNGEYFGEIALLSEVPRQATVTAIEPTKCLKIQRDTFIRVMGPLTDILKRNMEHYQKVTAEYH